MKFFISFIFSLLVMSAFGQKTFSINGRVKNLKTGAKIYLEYNSPQQIKIKDSAVVNNGEFRFKGYITEPTVAIIFLSDPVSREDLLFFYIEPGKLDLFSETSISEIIFEESVINKENKELELLIKPLAEKGAELRSAYNSLKYWGEGNIKQLNELDRQYQKNKEVIMRKSLLFSKKHPSSYISLLPLIEALGCKDYQKEVEEIFNALDTNLKQTSLGIIIGKQLIKKR